MMFKTPSRPEQCLSDLRFDRLLADELDADEKRECRAHVEGCPRCASRLRALEAERDAFVANAPPLRLPRPAPRGRVHWFHGAAASLAMAAAVMLFVVFGPHSFSRQNALPEPTETQVPALGTRTKGSNQIGFHIVRGDSVVRGGPHEVVRPNDRLQFTYSAQQPAYLAILSIDGAKKASVYFPAGDVFSRIEPGVDVPVSNSVVLDETLGDEVVIALFCDTPLSLEPLRQAFERSPEALVIPSGCRTDRVHLSKKAQP